MRHCFVVALAALLAGQIVHAAEPAVTVKILSDLRWFPAERDENFGGFSGIDILPDGRTFRIVNDRGWTAQGVLERDPEGQITAVRTEALTALTLPDGTPLPDLDHLFKDAEGLVLLPDGGFFVSFEGDHRVVHYAADGMVTRMPDPPARPRYPRNGSFEALAQNPHGSLMTLPERSGRLTRAFPVYRIDEQGWSKAFDLRRDAGFLMVGADYGPDGALYILERSFPGYAFQSRIRRVTVRGEKDVSETIIFTSKIGQFDNLEGLTAWQDPQGFTRLILISDDNFRLFQKTHLVEMRIEIETALVPNGRSQ